MKTILTCETDLCANQNIAIELDNSSDVYVCGVCMNEITNKQVVEGQSYGYIQANTSNEN